MPRELSNTAILAAQDVESNEAWLVLLEITHSALPEPFYLVNNTETITSNGIDYLAYPFGMVLGNDTGEKLPTVSLTIDNVDRSLMSAIRSLVDSPDVVIKVVLSSQPDVVEIAISELKLREVSYDAFAISGTLYADDILNQRWPKDQVTVGAGYYGLFR